jgi:hypothetical protein
MPNDLVPDGELIDRLARDLRPVRCRSFGSDFMMLIMLCAIEFGLFLGFGLMRPDMPMAMQQPSFWWKLSSLGLIALMGGLVAVLSFDPTASPRRGLRWLMVIVACCLLAGWLVDASRDGLPGLAARLNWPDGLQCVMKTVLLSVPAVLGLGLLMRRGAATDLEGTAFAAGIASATWGAFVFVFACPQDDPLYIAVWYAVGCGLVTAFARVTLPRLARW